MDNNFSTGADGADVTDSKRKRLQMAAIIFLQEAKFRSKSVDIIVEEFAGRDEVQSKLEYREADFRLAIGIAIAQRRRQLSMSQKTLAELTGMQRSYISELESGRRNLSLINLVTVASALGLSGSTLLESIEEIYTE